MTSSSPVHQQTPATRRPRGFGSHPRVLVVTGASGGLGTSTLAGALALEAARRSGASVLVDADIDGGGVDVTVGVEHLAGPRWPDLAEARGEVDGGALAALLPASEECAVLAADGRRERVVGDSPHPADSAQHAGYADVFRGLREAGREIVVDVPRARLRSAIGGLLSEGRGAVLLLTGTDVRRLADLDALVTRLVDSGWAQDAGVFVGLVTRGRGVPQRTIAAIADQTALPHLGHLPDDPSAVRGAERGEWPGRRGRLRRYAASVLDLVEEHEQAAASTPRVARGGPVAHGCTDVA